MSTTATSDAIERIERALARIEAVASRPPRASIADRSIAEIDARHSALRAEVTSALAELDTILKGAR